MPTAGLSTVFFDVGGTLLSPSPSLAEIYLRVLAPLGVDCGAASFRRAAVETWAELDARIGRGNDRYSHFPGGESEYWLTYVTGVLEKVSYAHVAEDAARALHATFSEASSWAVYPEVRRTLTELRRRGIRLGVISNWDSRLRALLDRFDLTKEFEAIVVSCEVGAEKPARVIFERALARMHVPPEEALHIGDDPLSDYEGARAAGMEAVLLARTGPPPPGEPLTVASLDALLEAPLLAGQGRAPK